MEDFIFGTFATDELKMVNHRLAHRGMIHAHAISPQDPIPNKSVTLSVLVGSNITIQHLACYYTTDESMPMGSRGQAKNGGVIHFEIQSTIWDTVSWGYVTQWQAIVPAQSDGTIVKYTISGWADDGDEIYADYPDIQRTVEHAAVAFFTGQEFDSEHVFSSPQAHVFNYHVDQLSPPDWAKDAVIYQVFPDRFYAGDDNDWLKPDNLSGFYGGTLWGVRDKLDYIAEFGANCIWLTPIFVSPSHHGYDALDYKKVEPRLGGDDALRAVIDGAHERGMRVLLDFACNHMSKDHPIFKEALVDPNSAYRDWFMFDDSEIGYRAFFGVPDLPEINVMHPDANAFLLDIAQFWIHEFDVDGYRLDYASGPGPDFWSGFRQAIRDVKSDSFCFGEIVGTPYEQRAYIGRLDGVLDFHVGDSIRKFVAYDRLSDAEFAQFLKAHQQYFPDDFIMPSFIDNHDMNRFLFASQNDKSKLKRGLEILLKLPNPPIIYYGTEVGLSQHHSKDDEGQGLEVSRLPMLWGDEQDTDLLEFTKALIKQRKKASN